MWLHQIREVPSPFLRHEANQPPRSHADTHPPLSRPPRANDSPTRLAGSLGPAAVRPFRSDRPTLTDSRLRHADVGRLKLRQGGVSRPTVLAVRDPPPMRVNDAKERALVRGSVLWSQLQTQLETHRNEIARCPPNC